MTGRILLVEDHELNRDMLSRRLRRAGYQVLTAANGERALGLIEEKSPDVVLMDMNLPVKDGWTTCREIRGRSDIAHVRIIALTAHAMGDDRSRALEAGCDDYATKPVDFPALLRKIERLADGGSDGP